MYHKESNVNVNFILITLFVINFSTSIGLCIFDIFLPLYLTNLGVTGLLLGVTVSAYAITKMLMSPILSTFSGNRCKKHVLLSCIALFLCTSIIYFNASSILWLILARIIQGCSAAVFRPVLLYTVNECLDGKNKASALGTFDISFYAAIGIGPFLGGLLKDMFGFKGVVAALIILCVFSLVLLVAFVPQHKTKQNDDVCFITKKSIFTNNRLISLYIFIFGRGFIIATTCSFLPILLTVKYGLSSSAVGFIMTCSTAVMVLFLRQAGKLADRISPLLLILFGGAAVSLTYVLIPLISGFYNFIILFSLIGIFSIVSQPASTLILVKESKKENLCTATGYLSSFMGLGVASGIVVGSVVMKMANINLVFFTASLVGFFTVLLASAAYSMSVVGRSVSLYNTESKEI